MIFLSYLASLLLASLLQKVALETLEKNPEYDYVVKFRFKVDEENIPAFAVKLIYERSAEHSITVEDVIELYKLTDIYMAPTVEFIRKLGFSPESVFSVDGLEKILYELQYNFNDLVSDIFIKEWNYTTEGLTEKRGYLEVNGDDFFASLDENQDTLKILKTGNLTYEAVESALNELNGKKMKDLFDACRNILFSVAKTMKTQEIVDSLKKYGFDKSYARELMRIQNVDAESILKNVKFKNAYEHLLFSMDSAVCLGVLTTPGHVHTNKAAYDLWASDQEIVQVYAKSMKGDKKLLVIQTEASEYNNIYRSTIKLLGNGEGNIPLMELGSSDSDIDNCTFITLNQDNLDVSYVNVATRRSNYIEIPSKGAEYVVPGSPLICENKLYGLAAGIEAAAIKFDTFSKPKPGVELAEHSGQSNFEDNVRNASFYCFVLIAAVVAGLTTHFF